MWLGSFSQIQIIVLCRTVWPFGSWGLETGLQFPQTMMVPELGGLKKERRYKEMQALYSLTIRSSVVILNKQARCWRSCSRPHPPHLTILLEDRWWEWGSRVGVRKSLLEAQKLLLSLRTNPDYSLQCELGQVLSLSDFSFLIFLFREGKRVAKRDRD